MDENTLACPNCGRLADEESDVHTTPTWAADGVGVARCRECGEQWEVR